MRLNPLGSALHQPLFDAVAKSPFGKRLKYHRPYLNPIKFWGILNHSNSSDQRSSFKFLHHKGFIRDREWCFQSFHPR